MLGLFNAAVIEVLRCGHIGDCFAVVGKLASPQIAMLGHRFKGPRIIDVFVEAGQKHFDASPRAAEFGVQSDVLRLEHFKDLQKQFVDVQLKPCLDGFGCVGILDIFGDLLKTLFNVFVTLPDDLLIVAEQLG